MIGYGEAAESLTRRPDHMKGFHVYQGEERQEVGGVHLRLPTGRFRPRSEGVHLLSYESFPQENQLPGAEFDAYLNKEGLDEALDLRRGGSGNHGVVREAYSRCAKSLILVGEGVRGGDQIVGLPLEIVAKTNVEHLVVGTTLLVQVLRDGEAIPGLLLKCFAMATLAEPFGVRTDEEGFARIKLSQAGRWMLSVVSIEPGDAASGVDWQSYWASLTFDVGESE